MPVVDNYLETLRSRCYSPKTLKIEAQWLKRLARHCQALQVLSVGMATREHLALFHQSLLWRCGANGQHYRPRTIDQGLRVIRSFFRWAAAMHLVLVDPTRGWVLPRVPQSTPQLLTTQDIERLLDMPSRRTLSGRRDRAVLETFYATGVRLSECANLDLTDVNLATQTLLVRAGKGNKDRWLPMGHALAATLTTYLTEVRPHLVDKSGETALWVTSHKWPGHRLGLERIEQMVSHTGRQAGLKVTPHLLRHACATHLLEAGADLVHIQQLLGHKLLQSTELYTHICPVELKRMHRQSHPRAGRTPPDH
jgi:integrase/recombinase XerD